jgi:hypothetical protein
LPLWFSALIQKRSRMAYCHPAPVAVPECDSRDIQSL